MENVGPGEIARGWDREGEEWCTKEGGGIEVRREGKYSGVRG